jgi:hypothetical protein
MKVRNWLRAAPLAMLMLAVWTSGCSDQGGSAERLLGPEAASYARGSSKSGWGKGGKSEPQVVQESGTGGSWRLASKRFRKGEVKSQAVIGAEGGYLYTGDHVIWVPKGAVDQPTEFKIQVFAPTSGDSTVAGVSLKAIRITATGDTVNVGKAGFLKPVILAVSYEESDVQDPAATRLLWITEPGVAELVPNQYVYPDKKWVVGYLEHFSEYGIGWPNLTQTVTSTVGGLLY